MEIAAVAAFMLWFSERTWVYHYVSFILVLTISVLRSTAPALVALPQNTTRTPA